MKRYGESDIGCMIDEAEKHIFTLFLLFLSVFLGKPLYNGEGKKMDMQNICIPGRRRLCQSGC